MNDHPANALFAFFTLKTTLKLSCSARDVVAIHKKKNEQNGHVFARCTPQGHQGGLGGTPATLYLNSPEQTFNLFFILKHFKKYKM